MVRIIITGACGKMGRAIVGLALQDGDIEITGLVEAPGHPMTGKAHDLMTGGTHKGDPLIVDDISQVINGADVVVDFTQAGACINHFRAAAAAGAAHVIGTTGFREDQLREIGDAKGARVVISPNMSVGMNILFDLAQKASAALKDGYDVEIVEMHHRWKKDAPSGSALRIKDAAEAGQAGRAWVEVFGRQGITGERKADEIGVMSIRGGDIVGEHTIFFAGIGERLELTHRAYSRDNFARGALLAAKWLVDQPAGVYSMKDVLGL